MGILIILFILIYAVTLVFGMFLVDIEQPIEFNHKKHISEAGLACIDCHRYFKTQSHSGYPAIDICLDCHSDLLTDSPEEKKLLSYAEKKLDIPWKRIYYMADHVFFSHQLHVEVAKINCEKCHGKMEEQSKPPRQPLVLHTMEFCMDCHKNSSADIDCLACHR
jgi:hypothetical protein